MALDSFPLLTQTQVWGVSWWVFSSIVFSLYEEPLSPDIMGKEHFFVPHGCQEKPDEKRFQRGNLACQSLHAAISTI